MVTVRLLQLALCLVAVASTALTGWAFPDIPAPLLIVGGLVQVGASFTIGRFHSPLVGVLGVALVTSLLLGVPSPWQAAAVSGVVIWSPIALTGATADLSTRARRPMEVVLGAVALAGHAVVMVVQSPSLPTLLNGVAPVLGGVCVALILRLRLARRHQSLALEARRVSDIESARAVERAAIAADMHDLLSDGLTRIVLQTRTLITSMTDPANLEQARRIEHTATTTLNTMRDRLKLINSSAETPSVPLQHATVSVSSRPPELIALVDEARELGEQVGFELKGIPPSHALSMSRPVWECMVRIVQEGLLNARKHAPGARVQATVTINERCTVNVSNARATRTPDRGLVSTGSGTGLRGLERRVRLLGGEFTVNRDHGFSIHATFPSDRSATAKDAQA